MRVSDATTLFDHLYWIRDRLLNVAGGPGLADTDLDAPPVRDEDRQPAWHYVLHLYSHGLQQFSDAPERRTARSTCRARP
jgi:hypothetical protein